jgi:hypothetical protein
MHIDAKTVAEMWESIRDLIPANKREEAVNNLLQTLVDNEVEIEDLEELHHIDDDMDAALSEIFEDLDLDEED